MGMNRFSKVFPRIELVQLFGLVQTLCQQAMRNANLERLFLENDRAKCKCKPLPRHPCIKDVFSCHILLCNILPLNKDYFLLLKDLYLSRVYIKVKSIFYCNKS